MASLFLNPPSSSNLFSLKKNPSSTTSFSRYPLLKNPNLSLFRSPKTNSRKLLKFSANNKNPLKKDEEFDDKFDKFEDKFDELKRAILEDLEKRGKIIADMEKSVEYFLRDNEKTELSSLKEDNMRKKMRNESNELKSILEELDYQYKINESMNNMLEELEKREKIQAEMNKSIETLQEYKKSLEKSIENSVTESDIIEGCMEYMFDPTIEKAKYIEQLCMIKKKISNPCIGFVYGILLLWLEEEIHYLEHIDIGSRSLKVNKMKSCFEHDTFYITDVRRFRYRWNFTGFLKKPVEEVMPKLEKKLSEAAGVDVVVYFKEDEYDMTKQVCTVEPKSSRDLIVEYHNLPKGGNMLAMVLCIASFGTTALMSSFLVKPNATFDDYLANVVPLFGGLFSILGVSEIATRITAAHYGVKLSPSFLIPSIWTGFLGVVNKYESLLPNNKALFDIPVARTSSAYLTSLVLVVTAFLVDGSFNGGDNPMYISPGFFSYNPLLSYIQSVLGPYRDDFGDLLPYVVEGVGVPVNPLAFAGIIGVAVTSINLLPFRRMEGGRIAQALFGHSVAEDLNNGLGLLLLAVGVLDGNVLCLVWFLVVSIQDVDETPVKDEITPLGDERRTLGFILQVICILTLFPNIAGRFSVFHFFGEIYEVISSSLSYNS